MCADTSKGRDAFERRAWQAAYDALSSAHEASGLDAADLWRLAMAAFLVGREEEFMRALQQAHQAHLDAGQHVAAARCAFWLGLHLDSRGAAAQANGWFGRATRLLDRAQDDGAVRGFLLVPAGRQRLMAGDGRGACELAEQAAAIGQRFGDADLVALALHLHGRALLVLGRVSEGLALLDEAMVAVTADDLSPMLTGLIYCSVIGACRDVWALRRAQEWTAALARWCDVQPEMVAYAGECGVYRAEILRMRGAWPDAMAEARRAVERFAGGSQPDGTGFALYLQAEVHRLRGEPRLAEDAYHAAARTGYPPQPGLALLRLDQGNGAAAAAAIRSALAETTFPPRRASLLPAYVRILLDVGELDAAREACDELAGIAESCAASVLDTAVAQARGAIALAAGQASAALPLLRRAWQDWQALDAPYDAACVRVLLGLACRTLDDEDGADLELQAARAEFQRLGAAPDLARLDALTRRHARRDRHGLTPREREVLALLATGRTNRAIADALTISEKTVARHVANIFRKLNVGSRSAATAFAYEHGLM
ncbi:MAG TPA: response regulator transcription factor [Longimicrobiales bacterium]|nr:response regulator transcription factor [Longimicrobiales bacterium]